MKKLKENIRAAFDWLLIKVYNLKTYQSIDTLPIFYWQKIHEGGNLSYLLRADSIHIQRKKPNFVKNYILIRIWIEIYDEMIARFGFSDEFLDLYRKDKEITILKAEMVISNDKTKQAFIKIAEIELDGIRENIDKFSGKITFDEAKGFMESQMGFRINPYECTVAEYYGYMMTMKKLNKKAK